MTIQVLVCRADGTQAVETREVPDAWFETVQPDDSVKTAK